MKTHKDLEVWKNSIELVAEIYKITNLFPKFEIYGLTNQMRRAAVSVPSNISEGAARNSKKEFIQFLYIAQGSVAELETQLIISQNLQFINENQLNETANRLNLIRSQITGLIRHLKQS